MVRIGHQGGTAIISIHPFEDFREVALPSREPSLSGPNDIEYISALRGPVIFGGDLNAPPASKTIRRIAGIARDAWSELYIWGGFTFRVRLPLLRLDYLFSMVTCLTTSRSSPDFSLIQRAAENRRKRFELHLAGE